MWRAISSSVAVLREGEERRRVVRTSRQWAFISAERDE